MNDFVEIIASLAECLILVRLCNGFLGSKNDKTARLSSLAVFVLLALEDIFLSQISGFEFLSSIIWMLIVFGYSALFLRGKMWEKLLLSILPAITILPINFIVMGAFTLLCGNDRSAVLTGGMMRIPVLFFTKVLFFFVCEFIVRIKRKQPYALTRFQWIIQLACFLISFLISVLLWNVFKEQLRETVPFLMIFLLIAAMNILLYILLNKMQRDSVIREEYRLSQINLAAQEQLVTEARERYAEMRELRHDMRHCLTAAAELIDQGKGSEAKEYIEKALNEKLNTSALSVSTGSAVIDAVINSRLADCAKSNIRVKCLVDTTIGGISDIDLSILVSNLLENAVRGCKGAEDPEIELVISTKKSLLYIMVKNSIPASVLSGNPELRTSKDDKAAHGFGVKSIKRLAEKYNGSAEFKEENDFFIVEVWLSSTK